MLTLLLSNVIAYNCYCVCSQRSDMCPISSSSALQFLSRKHQRLNNSNVNRGLQIQNTEITATVDQYERTTLQLLSPARPSHSITAAPLSKNVHRRKNNESSRAQSAIRSPQHFHSYENSRASISLCLYAAKMWLSCFFFMFYNEWVLCEFFFFFIMLIFFKIFIIISCRKIQICLRNWCCESNLRVTDSWRDRSDFNSKDFVLPLNGRTDPWRLNNVIHFATVW